MITPWPDGAAGQREGIAHCIKHWLNPAEMWEDIAGDAIDHCARHVLPRLGVPRVWEQAYDPSPTLQARWWDLRDTYRAGYLKILVSASNDAPSPETWSRVNDRTRGNGDLRAVVLSGGIYAEARKKDGSWHWWTAYRPCDFKLTDPDCPPRDNKSVQIRRLLAAAKAKQHLRRKAT